MSNQRERQHRQAPGVGGSDTGSDLAPGKRTLVELEAGAHDQEQNEQLEPDHEDSASLDSEHTTPDLANVQFLPGETADAFREVIEGISQRRHSSGAIRPSTPEGDRNLPERQIQRRSRGEAITGPDDIHKWAAHGVSSAGSRLPHMEAIQRSFGRHDITGIASHTDSAATAANERIGAEAYATGNHVAFRSSTPSLHTAAHEAAHVVQQRGGVHLKGGIGEAGDDWERHADTVADRVVQGQSAEDLLDQVSNAGHAPGTPDGGPVQMAGFVPDVTRSPDMVFGLLNDTSQIKVNVRNARHAPPGTSYSWRLRDADGEKLHPVRPLQRAQGALHIKPKRVFSELQVVPEVEVRGAEPTTTTAPAVSVGVFAPEPRWTAMPSAGGRGTGQARFTMSASGDSAAAYCYVGDTVNVRAAFDNLGDGATSGIRFTTLAFGVRSEGSTVGQANAGAVQWQGAVATLPLTATGAGRVNVMVTPTIPGVEEGQSFDLQLSIVNDPRGFKDKCSTANTLLVAKYSAGREFFLTASQNYKAGYDAHKAVLDARNRREQLTRDLLMSVLFGTLGGAVGGAVGGALKPTADAIAKAVSNAAAGALTDTVKDFTKAVARMPQQILSRSGGGSGGAMGSGTTIAAGPGSATGTAGVTGGGQANPAAQDPFGWFLAVERALEAEKTSAANQLLVMQQAADTALETGAEIDFDYDPVAALHEHCTIDGRPLDQLGTAPKPAVYEKAFWAAWLSQYAWTVTVTVHAATERVTHHATSNVDGKMRKAIREVAGRMEEDGDEWIARFGGEARANAEAQAARLNRISHQ